MSSKITGKEYPLVKIFGSDFEYHIPVYQRPYAWTTGETSKLFEDESNLKSVADKATKYLFTLPDGTKTTVYEAAMAVCPNEVEQIEFIYY